ncbi:SurA N-terminal domain-containing protein [Candidatus Planktophila lacus]|uniref:SurA N-terminal domain-containing protein n=1 Tax=Candidatus Planktophila lacus TaxID=1884913 RepID=UPI000BACAB73|nr:SurA N-terminal domain-containing protein [Candidatus Planktophila lacus]
MKKILVALTIATGLLLTGCSQSNEAATVGDFKITQTELQSSIDAVMAERKKVDTSQMQLETGDELNRGQLRFKILMHTFDEIAKELDLEITSSQVVARKQQISQSLGGDAELPKNLVNAAIAPQDFDTYVRAILISERITSALAQSGVAEADVATQLGKLLSAKAKELGVKINPRYGFWDTEAGDVVAADVTGGAVTPSAE